MPGNATTVGLDAAFEGDRFIRQQFRSGAQGLGRIYANPLKFLVVSHANLALRTYAGQT